jgi:hypothetical protein
LGKGSRARAEIDRNYGPCREVPSASATGPKRNRELSNAAVSALVDGLQAKRLSRQTRVEVKIARIDKAENG